MEYRNIDQDIVLLKAAERYWKGEITTDQLHWILSEKGYLEQEIDSALSDYYYVYIWTNILINRMAWVVLGVVCFIWLLIQTL